MGGHDDLMDAWASPYVLTDRALQARRLSVDTDRALEEVSPRLEARALEVLAAISSDPEMTVAVLARRLLLNQRQVERLLRQLGTQQLFELTVSTVDPRCKVRTPTAKGSRVLAELAAAVRPRP